MLHVDVAVLVFDEAGKIVESNPAVSRLLGKSISKGEDLDILMPLIDSCEDSISRIVNWQHHERKDTFINENQLLGDPVVNDSRSLVCNPLERHYKIKSWRPTKAYQGANS